MERKVASKVKKNSTAKKYKKTPIKKTSSNKEVVKYYIAPQQDKQKVAGKIKKTSNKSLAALLKIVNLLPNVLLVLGNLIKNNNTAIITALNFVKLFVKLQDEDKETKNFIEKFLKIFLKSASMTSTLDKAVIILAFTDIIKNEIPKIFIEAEKTNFIDKEKVFLRIIDNAVLLEKRYLQN